MILRDYFKLIFSVWLSVSTLINATDGERWSRQVSNSEWIPLAHPRSPIPQSSPPNNQPPPPPPIPSIQALNLPPSLRQEYQQQLHQLQKTQESIHKLLVLQQQIRSQQQLLQNQAYLPNIVGPDEEKQPFRQNSISNVPQHSELHSEVLVAPQLPSEILPAVYPAQEFKPSHQSQDIVEAPSASAESDEEKTDNGSNEEIQVVYVPAETLAQRGQPKEERNRDHKQFSFQRQQNQRYQQPQPQRQQQQQQHQQHQHQQLQHQQLQHQQHQQQQQQQKQQQQHHQQQQHQQQYQQLPHQHHPQHEQIENLGGSVNFPEDESSYNSELVQFPRGQAETDQFFKEARQKELDRLNEERKEIQKQAKIQAAARQREHERLRQREAEKKMKELAKIEELARQRELDRIREERERHQMDELKREKERTSKLKEELARREIERLAAAERQKQAEAERSRARQKELEKYARQEEEARAKELAEKKEAAEAASAAEQLINQQHQQHHTETIKHHKRTRNKPRQRPQHHHHKHAVDQSNRNNDIQTTTPTPNQPPLAVFMGSDLEAEEVKVVDVLRVLRNVKTIAVLDQIAPEAPKVFVGPSNLEPPRGYTKFDLPYLSALDTNRVERRVDKLPFFVAPLSFSPPQGYSKIPFPAPHIGSVIINNLESNTGPSGGGPETVHKVTPNPLIEPNSFIAATGQGATYQASFESPTVTPYSTYTQDHVTPQYQSSVYTPTPEDNFRYRQQQQQQVQEQPPYQPPTGSQNLRHPQSQSIPSYEEQVTASPRPHSNQEYSEQSYLGQVTPNDYRRPNVVSSFSYNQEQPSTTPAYHDSYAHTRVQPNKDQDLESELAQLNQHDYSQHRHVDNNYQHPSQQANTNGHHQEYHLSSNVQNSYEETSNRHPIGPPQYSLPAELPPIHPQLPGLVNSLSEDKEIDKIITTTTTTTPAPITTTTTTTSTTESPTTTYRVRHRQRGRITRPTTTSTTTSSPSTYRSHTERTRRPFNRSRSRYTTTTEEYRETSYEAAKDKVPETTPKYNNSPDQYRRPITPKPQKLRTRAGANDRTTYEPITTLNQIPNIQTHETLSDEASPSDESGDLPQTTYAQYNIPTESTPNAYLHQGNVENPANVYSTEIDYSKSQNYPRVHGPPRNERPVINDMPSSQQQLHQQQQQQQQQYPDRFSAQSGEYQASLDRQPLNGYEFDIRDGVGGSLPASSPTPNDYSYYQDKIENVELMGNGEQAQTEMPIYHKILEFAVTSQPNVQHNQSPDRDYTPSGSFDDRNRGTVGEGQLYNQYTSKELSEHQIEVTTEPIQTTTTEPAPVIYRQRVRARISGRPRQESTLQTQSRGPQDEYVRFSAVNQAPNSGRQSSSSSGSRSRDSSRTRLKTRPNHHNQAQVQSEGNEYVRIQSSNRATTYPKTIVQTARQSTTTTTTTPVPPLTTTDEISLGGDDNEYGFIRTPNFNQPHHQLSSKFRAPESQIQLQNIAPTDETAEDSSPTHTQIPKHRQKYQSPNRPRPIIKSSTTSVPITQSSLDNGPYTTKSRVRADEPKNRIRTKGRRPGRRRTTTTSTTTEYTLEGNNNLPLDENYPRILINSAERNVERQPPLYEQNYDIPQDPAVNVGPSRADYVEENYPPQDFALNFGGTAESEEHQRHLSHKHHATSDYRPESSSESRLRPYSNHATSSERDIYGSESQWSTKLTKSSFQPVNQLNKDEEKVNDNEHASQEIKEDVPEIITAQPEDAFMTVLVTSDDTDNKTKSESPSSSLLAARESVMESTDFGQLMNQSDITQSSAQPVEVSSTSDAPQSRRVGQRRRRVRVRVRPAPPDDFVTAESQYINSAVNTLVQDRIKYNTHVDPSSDIHSKTLSENWAMKQERPSPLDSTELSNSGESIPSTDTTTINYTEVPEHEKQSHPSTLSPINGDDSTEINNSHENMPMTTETLTTNFETTIDDVTMTPPLMTTMTIPRKSWDSTKAYSDWIMRKMEKSFTSGDNQLVDKSTINEDSNEQRGENESENYPKNHRSEWSEVRYPSDRGIYGYGRSEKLSPTTQLPGIVTKSVGDTNVKTLSDYVQAIFDTMKNADEERSIVDNAPNLWNDDQTKLTTSTEINDIVTGMSTDVASETNSISTSSGDNEKTDEKNNETTIQPSEKEIVNSTTGIIETSSEDPSMRTNTEITPDSETSASSIATSSEPSITSIETAVNPIKNATLKLGSVIRTSTTTKVSHMTEICYRGRCIMTKPKKDFHER